MTLIYSGPSLIVDLLILYETGHQCLINPLLLIVIINYVVHV